MNWLRESINDGKTGQASSKRIAMLSGAISMSIAVIVLSVAAALVRGNPGRYRFVT